MSDDIMRVLGQIEGKLDGVLDEQKDIGSRVRSLESKADRILGWAAGAGVAGGGLVAVLKAKIAGLFGHAA